MTIELRVKVLKPRRIECLNPCSNGMTIEFQVEHSCRGGYCLNPCSNGMTIESYLDEKHKAKVRVLILVLME